MRKVIFLSTAGSVLCIVFWLIGAMSCGSKQYNLVYEKVELLAMKRGPTGGSVTVKNADTVYPGQFLMDFFIRPHYFLVKNNVNPFVSTAMAYKPAPNRYKRMEIVSEINLKTINDFDAQHPAGASIWDIVLRDTGIASMEDYLIEMINNSEGDRYSGQFNEHYVLQLSKTTDYPTQIQQFEVEVITDKGSVLRAQTNKFYLR